MLGMPFELAAVSFGWGNLRDFSRNLPQTSATWRTLHQDESWFITPMQVSEMLASLHDAVMAFAYAFSKAYGATGQKPPEFPRPWTKNDGESIGSEPIPISEFNDWYYGGE